MNLFIQLGGQSNNVLHTSGDYPERERERERESERERKRERERERPGAIGNVVSSSIISDGQEAT